MSDEQKALAVVDGDTLLKLVVGGDTSALTPEQKLAYYRARCEAAGIDSRTAPFQFIKLQGKETLYATKGATDQLASTQGIRVEIQSQGTEQGVRVVHVRAVAKDGRQTDDIGAVTVEGLKGADLCNAYMKAVTKAKRRAILSLAGLGMMDESELETIPGATATVTPSPLMPKRASETKAAATVAPVGAILAQVIDPAPATDKSITLAQAKAFFAAARAAGKTDATVKAYVQTLGVAGTLEIPESRYKEVMEWADGKVVGVDVEPAGIGE